MKPGCIVHSDRVRRRFGGGSDMAEDIEFQEAFRNPRPLVALFHTRDWHDQVASILTREAGCNVQSLPADFVLRKSKLADDRPSARVDYTQDAPRGVLGRSWFVRLQHEIPAVLVVVFQTDFGASAEEWSITETAMCDMVEQARARLSGRPCRMVVVVVQPQHVSDRSMMVGADERMSG